MLGGDTVLVAAPDAAGAGLGPGATYVFQRDVDGAKRWGLVARLAAVAYPPSGTIEVRSPPPPKRKNRAKPVQTAQARPAEPAPTPPSEPEPPAVRQRPVEPEPEPPGEPATQPMPEPVPVEAPPSPVPPPRAAPPQPEAVPALEPTADAPPASEGDRYIVAAHMQERQNAIDLATDLRAKGYPAEVYSSHSGFFIVTIARLPLAEARKKRS